MPTLPLPDVTLHYEITGDGPPLLLIPGMLSDNASWITLVPFLQDRFTLILPDPRGAGQTRPLDAPMTLAALAGDMAALLAHLNMGPAHVLGHSLGGLVALTLSGQFPDRVASMTALATSPAPSARIPAIFDALVQARRHGPADLWLRLVFTWLYSDRFYRDPAMIEQAVELSLAYPHLQPPEAMSHQVRSLARLDIASLPTRLEVPAQAILAEEDTLILPKDAARAFEKLGLPVRFLPGVGHSPQREAPQAVADVLTDFIDGLA